MTDLANILLKEFIEELSNISYYKDLFIDIEKLNEGRKWKKDTGTSKSWVRKDCIILVEVKL